MIEWFSNIFSALTDFFGRIGDLIDSVVSSISKLFAFVGEAVEFVHNAFLMIPSYYVAYGAIILVVLIVFLVVGRQAGGE